MDVSMEKIAVIGCGYIGLPTSVTFALAGFDVCGVDVNDKVIDELQKGRLHVSEPGLQEAFDEAGKTGRLKFSTAVPAADVFIIAVQTPYKEENGKRVSDLTYVESAAQSVGMAVREGNLVVLESTSPPYTTRRVEEIVAEKSGLSSNRFMTVHCPERIIPGRILKELRETDRIIGGRPEAAAYAKSIYEKVTTMGTISVTDDLTAEMCKLVENTFRDINIAYANELSKVCDTLGIDVFTLIEFANRHPRVNIHTPGVGVGGHCIAVDPWFIHERFESDTPLIYTARQVNDQKPHWVAQRIVRDVKPGAKVAVLGMTYKADTDDIRESPSVELCRQLEELGYRVLACEPNIQGQVAGFENYDLKTSLEMSDYVVVTLAHRAFIDYKEEIRNKPHYDCVGLLR